MKGFASHLIIALAAFLIVIVLGILFFSGKKGPSPLPYPPSTTQESQSASPEPTLSASDNTEAISADLQNSLVENLDTDLSAIEKDLKEF